MNAASDALAPRQPSPGRLRVAAVQMVSGTDIAGNLARAATLVAEAADAGAELVVLPEYFCLMGRRDTDKVASRERPGDGPIQAALAAMAARHRVWLAGGTVPIATGSPGRVRNSVLVFGPDGTLAARYDKIHLFRLERGDERFDEAATIEPGRTPTVIDVGPWRVGLSVCYDLRFPELYRALGRIDLALVPSAFTYITGQAHWDTLLRARAIENQCFVAAAAQGGRHDNGRRTWGHTLVYDPWGERLGLLEQGEGVVVADLDRAAIDRARASLPAIAHRVL